MFQTEPILLLQSFSTPFLDTFFQFITSLGYAAFIQPFIIVIIFGINFRMGFLLLQLIMINVIATIELKEIFSLPRPFNVDSAVRLPGTGHENLTPLNSMGAREFWGTLPERSVNYFRMNRRNSCGFPSGHTSSAVVIWGGMAVIFKKPWLVALCALLIILIPFSRLYLGVHFMADVLGGFLLGGVLLLTFYLLVFNNPAFHRIIFNRWPTGSHGFKEQSLLIGLGIGLPALLVLLNISPANCATWAGINAGFLLVRSRGIPDDSGSFLKRAGRVAMAGAMFYLLDPLFDLAVKAGGLSAGFAVNALSAFQIALFIWFSTEAAVRLGWMKRNEIAIK